MKYFIQKSMFTLSVISVLVITDTHAASFSRLMKLGIVNSNSSNKEVVIFNDDRTKCLSTYKQKNARSKTLAYATCRMDDNDTWLITSAGKVKNKRSGKCLSTPKGEDKLELIHCSAMYFRDFKVHDYIFLDHLVEGKNEGIKISGIRN